MGHPMGEARKIPLRVNFDRRLRLEFHGSDISSDGGLLPCRELDDALGLPEAVEHWSLTTPREKLVKIGAKVVRHGRYISFQLAEVAMGNLG